MEAKSGPVKVGIAGAGTPGRLHAAGVRATSGLKLVAVADLIPDRLNKLATEFDIGTTVASAEELAKDSNVDAVIISLPTDLHVPVATACLKAGKHVVIEFPPAVSLAELRALQRVSEKAGRVVLFSAARRYGAAEQSTRRAIEKGYVGTIYHARASLLRTRGVPRGTGWYTDVDRSGGGAAVDLALPLIDLIGSFVGAKVTRVYAVGSSALMKLPVEELVSMILTFDNGMTAEVSCAWAINQPTKQEGMILRLAGTSAAVDVYTPTGPVLYRNLDNNSHGKAADVKVTELKAPAVAGHAALLRHFRDCVQTNIRPAVGVPEAVELMNVMSAVYTSMKTGKAVAIKS